MKFNSTAINFECKLTTSIRVDQDGEGEVEETDMGVTINPEFPIDIEFYDHR